MVKSIVNWFLDLRITSKIMLLYFLVLIVTVSLIVFSYQEINNELAATKVDEISMETVKSIDSNLSFLINAVSNQSKILISNQNIQSALRNNKADYNTMRSIDNFLSNFLNFNDMISSVYIFDNNGNEYYSDANIKNISLDKISNAPWYDKLTQLKGGFLLNYNGGGTFDSKGKNYVSMIRIINDVDTQKQSGIMVMNISTDYILASLSLQDSGSDTGSSILIRDDNGNDIVRTVNYESNELSEILQQAYANPNRSVIPVISGKKYIVSCKINTYNWHVISVLPFDELTRQSNLSTLLLFFGFLIIGLLFAAGLIMVSLLISKPIQKLAKSMIAVKEGKFKEVTVKTGNDEIGELKDIYNLMIREIQALIENIVSEQKMKRKMELEVLQSQIKPHFLYNSFDAIYSLVLLGDTASVRTIVKALSKFYKSFLNNKNEVITIGEELQMVENYLTIQKIRFKDKFEVKVDIDGETLGYPIPRLVLQPLVENAINHGIRHMHDKGLLEIRSIQEQGFVRLVVSDNGAGMDEEQLSLVMEGQSKGVGLRTTIERLKMFYNNDDIIEILSDKVFGTTITINIPSKRSEQ